MIMIVDTCVWIDYFNGRVTPQTKRLQTALQEEPEEVFISDIIYFEILSGFPLSHQKRFDQAKTFLDNFEVLEMENRLSAVNIIRKLRDKGITLKGFHNGLLDVIIAQTAIDSGQRILSSNASDFNKIRLVSELEIEES
jgi:predicted nucleic acid-binding protein